MSYNTLNKDVEKRIILENETNSFIPVACEDNKAIRRIDNPHDKGNILRSNFIRDIDKILNLPYYNRYGDKTQVFPFYKNDDITRRSQHVQLVSRIARTIGKALHLNLELIEAIALSHDLGHTPFGHNGEYILNEIYHSQTNRYFSHSIQSVRIVTEIFPLNLTLQTLSGIASHNGEIELIKYQPKPLNNFKEFDEEIEGCYLDVENVKKLIPSTLEGCIVRICDIIAYLGKDRQDVEKLNIQLEKQFQKVDIGDYNGEMINNLMINIIENSYGKNYIALDEKHFNALKIAKLENTRLIYTRPTVEEFFTNTIKPMFKMVYFKLLEDLKNKNTLSPIFTHHINYINKTFYKREFAYGEKDEANQIVVDYISSMTDDYFLDLFNHLFPNSPLKVDFKGYF